ncbi:Hypothetical predicted protein [Octopus vulgaris]|uniref:Uncharacterized protein n=1 Tax=Octopus vulgaris TaxID=6645 RepID=A0AA36AHP2_OCTVU|nr:Hypothetical predicted protein [Octopus vulgaris]
MADEAEEPNIVSDSEVPRLFASTKYYYIHRFTHSENHPTISLLIIGRYPAGICDLPESNQDKAFTRDNSQFSLHIIVGFSAPENPSMTHLAITAASALFHSKINSARHVCLHCGFQTTPSSSLHHQQQDGHLFMQG